jgi:c-di-AMP phosphodiesterase-like protein
MWIPNYLIILCICLLFYWIIWIIHDTQNPLSWFYKSSLYTDWYSAIWIILFIILIIYLFVKTDKKYFFMFKSWIFICLWITIVVFLLFKNSYKIERHYETTQKLNESIQKANETLQKQWYKDLSDYLEKNRDQLIDNYYNSN